MSQLPIPNPNTPFHTSEDASYLQSINESSIFLHDGVLRSINLKSLKEFEQHAKFHDALTISSINQIEEIIAIASNNVDELSRKIIKLSTLHVQGIALHHRYQWNVLERLWRHKQTRAIDKVEKEAYNLQQQNESEIDSANNDTGGESSRGLNFKLGISLLLPMIEIYANQNNEVALSAMQLIFEELANVPVMSLNQENSRSLQKLGDLLGRWGCNKDAVFQVPGPSALIAWACAHGTTASFAKTVLMLENLDRPQLQLPVANILKKLNDARVKVGKPCGIISEKHFMTWSYDDRLMADGIALETTLGTKSHPALNLQPKEQTNNSENRPETSSGSQNSTPPSIRIIAANAAEIRINKQNLNSSQNADEPHRHYVATDGNFLFVTGTDGKGISKIGTGIQGTLQGWVYHNNIELNCGLLAFTDGILISRPLELDWYDEKVDNKTVFGVAVNPCSLKPEKLILIENSHDYEKPFTTLGMTSDGSSVIYLLRAELPKDPGTAAGQSVPPTASDNSATDRIGIPSPVINVWMDVFCIEQNSDSRFVYAVPKSLKVALVRQEDAPEHDKLAGAENRLAKKARSVRLTNTPPIPPPLPTSLFGTTLNNYECMNTSLNVNFKQLQTSLLFTCGNYVTIIVSSNSQLYLPLQIGPTSAVTTTMRQYAPVTSASCPKTIAVQIHLCMNGATPIFTKQDLLNLAPESSFFHGAIIPEMGACYDHVNNIIWTVNGLFVDAWKNPGHGPLWKQNQIFLANDSVLEGSSTVSLKTATTAMLQHIGITATHFLTGDKTDTNIGFDPNVIKSLVDLLHRYRTNFGGSELTSIFLTLQAIVSQLKVIEKDSEVYKDLNNVHIMILCFLNDPYADKNFSSISTVYKEACKFFGMTFDLIYSTKTSRNDFFYEMYDFLEPENTTRIRKSLMMLDNAILGQFSESLNNPIVKFEEGMKWVLETVWLAKIIQIANEEIHSTFNKITDKNFAVNEVINLTSKLPVVSTFTTYINSVVNFFLRSLILPNEFPRNVADTAIEVFREVLKAGPALVETCLEYISSIDVINLAVYNSSEAIIKSSILAHGIPQILGFLSLDLQHIRPILDELTEECIQLTVALSFLANKLNPTTSDNNGEDWSSTAKIPSPWNTKKTFESTHPVKESFKSKETIIIPEARQLYVKLQPQSATQYDYDRLTLYSGVAQPVSRKVAEFGGNYYGYGNRYFSGPGWARTLVKIDGNSMAYGFEMKSGREHSVPDKALWGFQFSVFPIMDYSDVQKPERSEDDKDSILPVTTGFTTLTALHCIDVIQNMSRALLQGNPPTVEETRCNTLLENRFVAGLKWPSRLIGTNKPARKFPSDLMEKLKKVAGVPPLQMRMSIAEKMRALDLEELYFQCCMQHIGPNPYLNTEIVLTGNESSWNSEPTRDILREIFRNVETMFRKIMAFYEMEKMFCQEIEEISSHTKNVNDTFFKDPSFLESNSDLQTLASICYLEYDKSCPTNLINDVIEMVTALSADGSAPQLTRTDELIEETHVKCKYLLAASQNSSLQPIGPVPLPSTKMVLERLHDIHGFISAHIYSPNVTIAAFTGARRSRRERAGDRIKGLDVLHKVLECSNPSSALLVVTAILIQSGPRLQNILCSGLEKEVIKIFGEVMKTAVSIAEKNPLLHRYTIALLSVTAYDRTDEENLVESGLVGLLDQLCAFQTGQMTPLYRPNSPVEHSKMESTKNEVALIHNKASTLAWAAFQVLASQCASWERSKLKFSDFFGDSEWDEPEHRELPLQISINITNHLARAAALAALSSANQMESLNERFACSPNLTVAIQDVLDLLSNLRTYKIGRAILKQSPCVCRLLGLLQDTRLSPRLVLTILKLLHTALPLVDDLDTANFKQIVPRSKSAGNTIAMNSFWSIIDSTPYTQVASMLLTKLADYLVCGPQHASKTDTGGTRQTCHSISQGVMAGLTDPKFEKMDVWVHKTSDQSTASLIRQLFVDTSRQDLKPTRATQNELEIELNTNGKVLLYTEESAVAERKALRISQLGHLVTLLPMGFARTAYTNSGLEGNSRGASDILCKDRNSHLSSWDPARPFLSGNVAENLSSEIVQLIRALLSSSSSNKNDSRSKLSGTSSRGNVLSSTSITSSQCTSGADNASIGHESITSDGTAQLQQKSIWSSSVEQVICAALKLLPKLSSILNPITAHIESYVYSARIVIAALTVLGGFTETIRPGLEVWIVDERKETLVEPTDLSGYQEEWEFQATKARIISVSDVNPTAKVEIISKGHDKPNLLVPQTINVPVSRLVPVHFQKNGEPNLPSLSRLAQIEIAGYLKSLLLPASSATGASSSKNLSSTEYPLKKPLPTLSQIVASSNSTGPVSSSHVSDSRAIAQAMTIVRLLAEIRSKAMQVLSLWLKKKEFADIFLGIGSISQFQKKFGTDVIDAAENLKEVSKQCIPSHKMVSLESQVAWMRLLYRDCTKPPRLPIATEKFTPEGMRWDMTRTSPKIRSTVFSSMSNSVVYTGDYNVSAGNPRGLVLFGNSVIPTTGFYWEATIVSMEDLGQHADLIVVPPLSVGFAPLPPSITLVNDVWKYPSGTVLYTTLGRVIHYKTQDPGSWVTLRLDDENFRVKAGDTIGIGWEKTGTTGIAQGTNQRLRILRQAVRNPSISVINQDISGRRQRTRSYVDTSSTGNNTNSARGVVYFTLNGRRLPPSVEQSNCSLHPIIHIQKRQMVVHTNLGEKPFLYSDANKSTKSPDSGTENAHLAYSTETGTSHADILLRRVSDSLQDLNLVFNISNIPTFSEHDLSLSSHRSGSGSTISEESNNSTHRDDDDWGVDLDEPDDGDDDDSDPTEAAVSEPNIARTVVHLARGRNQETFRVLPPTPISGVTVSGSSLIVNVAPPRQATNRPATARKDGNSLNVPPRTANSLMSLDSGQGNYVQGKKNEVVAKPRQKYNEYDPTSSLEYYMGSSPTAGIRVFQGPPRYTCPCAAHCHSPLDFLLLAKQPEMKAVADIDALDGYEDDDDDDVHSLLVRAWEAQVFPTIRRRFRNESERRDGLEQIRGALQLGMLDIARQTVEFLYEEGGGIPRDLHFPTLEEVRVEATRCTMDKLKPGMSVIIRSLQDITDANVLPNHAVTGMLRTFGLVGEVLEVDTSHDLVLVETYIESEGVLVRFWYPVNCLDKSQSTKKPTLSTNTVNMFKLHSNLISMESSLCNLFSRSCYLSIAQQCNKNMNTSEENILENDITKISPIATQIFHYFDLESIQILSDNLLANYPPSRDLFTYNLQCQSPTFEFLTDYGNTSVLFYKNHEILADRVRHQIRSASKSGEEAVNQLTGKLLHVLTLPEKFPRQDVSLDKVVDMEVSIPGVAFTLISFKGPQTNKQITALDNAVHPCLHLSSYDSSDVSRFLMACYPLEPLHVVMHRSSSSSEGSQVISHTAPTTTSANVGLNKTTRKRHNRFPPVLCPTERIHCSISEANLPDVVADVQGIPKEFPLALLYIQELVKAFNCDDPNFTCGNITHALTYLVEFIEQIHLSPVIKDWIFTLLAELSRVSKNERNWKPLPQERVSRSCTPNRLLLELLLLRDKEVEQTLPSYFTPITNALSDQMDSSNVPSSSKSHPKGKQFSPAVLMDHVSSFITSHQKSNKSATDPNFSFYFTSLNDLCLAFNEVSEIMVNPYEIIPCAISTESSPVSSPQRLPSLTVTGSITNLTATPISVQLPNKKTIPKVIRKRGYTSKESKLKDTSVKTTKDKSGQGSSSASEKDKAGANKQLQPTPSVDGLQTFAKSSEIEWFNNEVIITRVLRDIVWHSPNDIYCVEAAQVLICSVLDRIKNSSFHNRLLVIQGAPLNIDGMSIESSLMRALRGCGGVHGNEMWISGNSAVIEVRCLAKMNDAFEILKQNKVWYPLEDYVLYPTVNVYRVNDNLKVSDSQGDPILQRFLKSKLADPEIPDKLNFKAIEALTSIFMSCYSISIPFVIEDSDSELEGNPEKHSVVIVSEDQMNLKIAGNLLELFISAVTGDEQETLLKDILNRFGEKRIRKAQTQLQSKYINQDITPNSEATTDGEEKVVHSSGLLLGQITSHDKPDEMHKEIPDILDLKKPAVETGLSLEGFLKWCTDLLKTQANILWKGLIAAGYDIRFDRTWLAEDPRVIYNFFHSDKWGLEKDVAVISYLDAFSQSLHIDPTRIQSNELFLPESDFVNPNFAKLQGVEIPYIRLRWGMLQKLNNLLSKKLFAHASIHTASSTHKSLGKLLHDARQLMLYYAKDAFLYKIIHASASRGSDTPTPEITLDPVSAIGSHDETTLKNQLSHIIQQMSTITTAFYCVPPAQGADPALPVSVKFQGEEVLGLSGSFRHFLLNASKQLQNETVKLLCRCPSADAGKNKDCFIITPGKLCYREEDFLHFLGQLIGISMRADAPLALPLLKTTWKSLLLNESEFNDESDDLQEADILCSNYLKKLESLTSKTAFENFLSLNAWPKFQYPSMDNISIVPLCTDGSGMSLSFSNRDQFINLVKRFREKELRSKNKVMKILTGLATIIPLPVLHGLFTSNHLELRISGSPEVNLALLKSHTHYQVGISENDPHILYFWAALESFTSEELKKFIKFSTNLERLPATCPCQSTSHQESSSSSNANTIHVPPFPMKIAPIDLPSSATAEEIDKRLIRVETCLFLIRLPPYSSLQVTRKQLLFAINCREDPLSG